MPEELGSRPTNRVNRGPARWLALACATLGMAGELAAAAADAGNPVEFFEKRVRPILVDRCYPCHSAKEGKRKGGLWLDSRESLLAGGEGGIVVEPGHPERSRLIEAIHYADVDLQMPPKGRLPDQEVADLSAWVKLGAPWPQSISGTSATAADSFNLGERRRRHWSWKPISPPLIPIVTERRWIRNPIDAFILAGLERNQLHPAPPAESVTLRRRIHFDLVGLPPTLEPQGAELAQATDESDSAYERLVDKLLAAPAFGERWGRHWLDLVRYGETLGHEFDYDNPNAWRYRDYVIRALNADVPYPQFVKEHVAGDLLDPPRRHPTEGFNESVIGTSFYWLGQREHSPVDIRQHQAELIDNQIDVLTKTFLGLTVACARCHDHKFDAIPTADYYSLYGILSSSRYTQAAINPPEPNAATRQRLLSLKRDLRQAVGRIWARQASETGQYLLAAEQLNRTGQELEPDAIDETAAEWNLDRLRLENWVAAVGPVPGTNHRLFGWVRSPSAGKQQRVERRSMATEKLPLDRIDHIFADFTNGGALPDGWFSEGEAFGSGPAPAGAFVVGNPQKPIQQILETPRFHSGILSRRLQGILRSPTFTITNRYVHVWAAGRGTRINVPVENFTMIRDPIYGGLKRVLNHDELRWITIDLEMWMGYHAYLEFSDISAPDPADDARKRGFPGDGYLAVERVVFSDHSSPPAAEQGGAVPGDLEHGQLMSPRDLATASQRAVERVVQTWAFDNSAELQPNQIGLLNWLIDHALLDTTSSDEVRSLVSAYIQTEASLSEPMRVPAMTEGTGLDENVFVRGNPRLPGQQAPRRFLQAIAGSEQPPFDDGSGRLELARAMVAESNPFLARVMVNRVWLHLFGRGLVATPDVFGELGQAPSHPELLDWLAHWFRTDGQWSVKRLVRLLVTSNTYRMSSKPGDPSAAARDPDNLLWHRMPVRRLEGEVIRDAILAISGRLDPVMFGPPVPVHLTEFMEGRGRPGTSGPRDGAGRRSIYLEARRNFISPMMRAFDMPVPFTTIGRRTVSNVPAQALILMNDPFIAGEANRWARQILSGNEQLPEERIRAMYRAAFDRAPSAGELEAALKFLRQQGAVYAAPDGASLDPLLVWADLAHVLFNVKEFIFIN